MARTERGRLSEDVTDWGTAVDQSNSTDWYNQETQAFRASSLGNSFISSLKSSKVMCKIKIRGLLVSDLHLLSIKGISAHKNTKLKQQNVSLTVTCGFEKTKLKLNKAR